jgi:hypothetical protein
METKVRVMGGVALLILALTGAGSGCRESNDAGSLAHIADPTCDAIGARLRELAGADLRRLEGPEREVMEQQLVHLTDAYVTSCKKVPWPDDTRACFLAAGSGETFDQCARDLAGQWTNARTQAPAEPGTGAPAAASGSDQGAPRQTDDTPMPESKDPDPVERASDRDDGVFPPAPDVPSNTPATVPGAATHPGR